MYRVTLTYMNCLVCTFRADSVFVGAHGDIRYVPFNTPTLSPIWSGYVMDGNTRIEMEPAEENA